MIRTFGILSIVTLFTLTGSLSGCVIVKEERHHSTKRSRLDRDDRRGCHPSQYWDGEKCRHKGKGKKKGKGHRKHHHH